MNELLQAVNGSKPEFRTELQSRWATCSRHGFEYVEVWIPSLELWTATTGCPSCVKERESGQPQPMLGQTMHDFRLQQAGIPERFRNKTLNDFSGRAFREALEVARSFRVGEDNALIIGPIASGKTSLACGLLSQCSELGKAEYHAASSMAESLWSASRPAAWEEGGYSQGLTDALSALAQPMLLVVDDVQDFTSAEECSWLQRVLGMRHKQLRSTILVAPNIETLGSVLGSRALDEVRGWKLLSLGKGL
jgi:hypothetical protein